MNKDFLIKSLENLSEELKKANHEDIVAGVKVPSELKQHSEPVPREHPHREIASQFVTAVHRRNPFEGLRMSQKYLGIGENGKILHPNALPPQERFKYSTLKSELEKAKFEEGPSDREKRNIRQTRSESIAGPAGTTERFNPKGKITPIGILQRWKSLQEYKRSRKPNLPKSEDMNKMWPMVAGSEKDEKGVHKPYLEGRQHPGKSNMGVSEAGFRAKLGSKQNVRHYIDDGAIIPDNERQKKFKQKANESAKAKHRQVLFDLKSMLKPRLPKSELDKNLTVAPASISEPVITGRVTTTEPKIIQSPNVFDAYTDKRKLTPPTYKTRVS